MMKPNYLKIVLTILLSFAAAQAKVINISAGENKAIKGTLNASCQSKFKLKVKEKLKLNLFSDPFIGDSGSIHEIITDSKGIRHNGLSPILEAGTYNINLLRRQDGHPVSYPYHCNPETTGRFKLDLKSTGVEANDDHNSSDLQIVNLQKNITQSLTVNNSKLPYDRDHYRLMIPSNGFLLVSGLRENMSAAISNEKLDPNYYYKKTLVLDGGYYNFVLNGNYLLTISKYTVLADPIELKFRFVPASDTVTPLQAATPASRNGFIVPSSLLSDDKLIDGVDYAQILKATPQQGGILYYYFSGDFDDSSELSTSPHHSGYDYSLCYNNYFCDNYSVNAGEELSFRALMANSTISTINSTYTLNIELFPYLNDGEGKSLNEPASQVINLSSGETHTISGTLDNYIATTSYTHQEFLIRDTDVYQIELKDKSQLQILNTNGKELHGTVLYDAAGNYLESIDNDRFDQPVSLKAGIYYLLLEAFDIAENDSDYQVTINALAPQLNVVSGEVEINLSPQILKNIDHFASPWKSFIQGQGQSLQELVKNHKLSFSVQGSVDERENISLKDTSGKYSFNIFPVLNSITDITKNISRVRDNYLYGKNASSSHFVEQSFGSINKLYANLSPWSIYKVDARRDTDSQIITVDLYFGVLQCANVEDCDQGYRRYYPHIVDPEFRSSGHNLIVNKSLPHGRFKLKIQEN